MATERRWLDRGEIIQLFRDESEEWRKEVREHQNKQNETNEKLRDGAQASLNTSAMLFGDPRMNYKGMMPTLQDDLKAVQADVALIHQRLDVVEKRQRTMLRTLRDKILKDDKGEYSYSKITAAATSAGAVGSFIWTHWKVWAQEVSKWMGVR